MFHDLNLPAGFTHFGTGGLVSMSDTKNPPPVIMYSVPLVDVLNIAKIPLGEVYLVVFKDENVDLQDLIVNQTDEVKLFSAVGGG